MRLYWVLENSNALQHPKAHNASDCQSIAEISCMILLTFKMESIDHLNFLKVGFFNSQSDIEGQGTSPCQFLRLVKPCARFHIYIWLSTDLNVTVHEYAMVALTIV